MTDGPDIESVYQNASEDERLAALEAAACALPSVTARNDSIGEDNE